MGSNQSKLPGHRRKGNRSQGINPVSISSSRSPIENKNAISNNISGRDNLAINNNPNFNLGPGASAHFAPVNYFNVPAPDPSDAIQAAISAALKGRHVPQAVYGAQIEKGCMEGTRLQVLQDIENWILNPKAQQIFWISGKAGMGKTAIARTVCTLAHDNANILLGGSFFCSRSTRVFAQRDVRCVVPTLAQLLARQSTEFSEALAAELKRDPDILYQQVTEQIKRILYTPLLAIKESPKPILFVIDALDECGDQPTSDETANSESHRIVSEMLKALVDLFSLPVKPPVKILVTSRPETHIRDTPVADAAFSSVLHLHTVNKEQVTADIRRYISTQLSSSKKLQARFTDDDADMLADMSDGLFIVATTALNHVLGEGIDSAVSRFRTLLNSARDGFSSRAAVPLDRMYGLILADATRATQADIDVDELQEILHLLASLLSARMPLSIAALADLLDMDKDEVRARFSRLHAVVHIPDDDDDPSLRTLHASFGDYLVFRASGDIRVTGSLGHEVLAQGCLRVLGERLHFNISQSHSSYESNSETRPVTVTLALEYACLQWIYHVAAASVPSEFDEAINAIFRPRFLFWLEVVSILRQVSHAAAFLFFASSTVDLPELSKFLRDANAFVASSHEAIERSAPHIYLSALPFAAKDKLVYKTFVPLSTGLISVTTVGIDQHGGRLIMTLPGHEGTVRSVTYSPNGHLIGSGSSDGTVRIWDTRTGEETMSPMRSGDGTVWSVAFAPNGKDIAAGTEGGVICIWNISASQGRPRRLSGHSDRVWCVSFSLDGVLLASASRDKTLRIWQAESGHSIAVLNGHTDDVGAAAFSPDGAILASCSDDGTIRLWHIPAGQPSGPPLRSSKSTLISISFSPDSTLLASGDIEGDIKLWDIQTRTTRSTLRGHSKPIWCVKFSPDGNSLASASEDQTIQLWTIPQDTSETPSIVFDGHTSNVYSASFSPNGMHIASASADRTIRIWDAGTGKNAVQPLPVHEGWIHSVAVSPCGTFIVSGSKDHSVRIWDTQTGEPRLAPLLGHTGPVYSVAISLDGHMIASASADYTVRLWDAVTGDVIDEPLIGHEDEVTAVAFSPDSQRLASGSDDQTVLVWNVSTGKQYGFVPLRCDGEVKAVVFSSDGQLLAAADDTGRIHFWRPETSQLFCKALRSSAEVICSIGFSPDGNRVVASSVGYGVRVWDVHDGKELLSLGGQGEGVLSVTFSPDGQLICSGWENCTVQLWNASTGVLISTLHGHTDWVRSVVFTPSGQSVVSCSDDMTIRVWDVSSACSQSSGSTGVPVVALASSTLKDGWLLGPSNELLLWVPLDYRPYLPVSACTLLIGRYRVSPTIGSSGWYCGENWTSCRRKDPLNPIADTT